MVGFCSEKAFEVTRKNREDAQDASSDRRSCNARSPSVGGGFPADDLEGLLDGLFGRRPFALRRPFAVCDRRLILPREGVEDLLKR